MKATFNFKVVIDDKDVNTDVGIPEKVENMNLALMKKIMDVMSGIEKRFKQQVALFYDEQKTAVKAENQEKPEGETGETSGVQEESQTGE